jgi:hypothetical protein
VPWKFRIRGTEYGRRVIVELFTNGNLQVITEDGRELSPSEARWIDEVALPELRAEWAALPYGLTVHYCTRPQPPLDRRRGGQLLVMAPIPRPISEMAPDELRAFSRKVAEAMRLRYDADPAECGHESGHER